tara:strand:+ start:131 stop:388 length:258 start_codon:yes stop_codon:yes gene_type:complete
VVLDVLFNVGESLRVFSVVQDSNGRSTSSLSGDTIFIVFALSEPFTEILSLLNGDEWDFVLLGEGGNEFFVFWIITVLSKDAEIS